MNAQQQELWVEIVPIGATLPRLRDGNVLLVYMEGYGNHLLHLNDAGKVRDYPTQHIITEWKTLHTLPNGADPEYFATLAYSIEIRATFPTLAKALASVRRHRNQFEMASQQPAQGVA